MKRNIKRTMTIKEKEMDYLKQIFEKKDKNDIDIFCQKYKHYGPANREKILYYIEENSTDLGFFAMYRYWLEYLYFADICGYTPVICADDNFPYKEDKPLYGTTNPFEYYFVQPSAISPKEAKHSNKVILSDIVHRNMVELVFTGKTSHYKYNSRYLYMMGHIVGKYMMFNHKTKEYIESSLKKINFENGKILGIHVRGTDYRAKFYNHPVYLTEEDCFVVVDELVKKGAYDRIFLATDDKRILDNFIKKYGKKLCFYEDVERSSQNKSVAFSKNSREHHKYLLGLEVIRDMYTLSLCSGLIAGISQVAICAQINKISRGERYEEVRIIDKGIYRNSHFFSRK